MKKLISLFAGIIAVVGLAACAETTVEAESYYVAIDINPSIEFIVDPDDIVVSYNLLNEDAEVLVADVDFVGMNVDEAVELFIQLATEAGYIDVDSEDNAVLITVLGDEENEFVERVRNRIKERVGRFFVRNYIKGEVLSDDFSQQDLVAQAQELGVSPGKLSLALVILGSETEEEYVLEELLELPVKDLMELLKEYHSDSMKEYTQTQLENFQARREALYELHKARFDEYVADNPELTEDEIDALWEQFQNRVKATNRANWQERVEEWKENHPQPPVDDDPDTTQDDSTQTS